MGSKTLQVNQLFPHFLYKDALQKSVDVSGKSPPELHGFFITVSL